MNNVTSDKFKSILNNIGFELNPKKRFFSYYYKDYRISITKSNNMIIYNIFSITNLKSFCKTTSENVVITFLKEEFKYELRKHKIKKLTNGK